MTVFKKNLKVFFSSPIKLAIVFLLPFMFVLLFVSGGTGNLPTTVAVFDHDNTKLTKALIGEIEKSSVIVQCDENEVLDLLINSKVEYTITIEEGYTNALLSGKDVHLEDTYFINKEKLFPLMMSIEAYLNNAVNLYNISNSEEDFYLKLEYINDFEVSYSQKNIEINSSQKTVDALGFMIQFIIYSGIILAAFLLIDKETNSTIRILVSPKSLASYIFEHFLSYIVLEIIIVASLLTTLKVGFDYSFNNNFLLILLMIILFSISIIAFCIMVISILKNSKASYWFMLCATTPLIMIGGCYFDVSNMSNVVQNISKFLPTRWIMDVIRDVLLYDNTEKVTLAIVVLIAFTVVYLSISRIGLRKLLSNK
ncbi:MAG: ABC transporter permease [Clostridiales bacterium]|nr:ABC transporter permease [Clostridiales bacterium]